MSSTFEKIEELERDVDQIWMVTAGIFVLLMQSGFAMLEAGSVHSKNTINVSETTPVHFYSLTVTYPITFSSLLRSYLKISVTSVYLL